jgi:hypothetical protein
MIRFFGFVVLFARFSIFIQAQAKNLVFVEKGHGARSSGCALRKYDLWIQVPNPKTKYEAVVRINRFTVD